MKRVSFQGEHGAYSESAAVSFFKEEIETIPCVTFADALDNTANDKTQFSILPVENSLAGSVGESNDLLYSTVLNAIGETYHKIQHCLIGFGRLDDISTVYSHPQALGQCRKFIQDNGMKTVPAYDTAGSAGIIKNLNSKENACIASKNASEIYDIPIIKEGIADKSDNYTRFLILSKDRYPASKKDKTTIIFSIKHEPGALYRIIELFYNNQINLTKIESRPKKDTVWEYNFYVDFEGSQDNEKVSAMLDGIRENTLYFKVLGSYPMANQD